MSVNDCYWQRRWTSAAVDFPQVWLSPCLAMILLLIIVVTDIGLRHLNSYLLSFWTQNSLVLKCLHFIYAWLSGHFMNYLDSSLCICKLEFVFSRETTWFWVRETETPNLRFWCYHDNVSFLSWTYSRTECLVSKVFCNKNFVLELEGVLRHKWTRCVFVTLQADVCLTMSHSVCSWNVSLATWLVYGAYLGFGGLKQTNTQRFVGRFCSFSFPRWTKKDLT